jgi:hypothetical protein
MEKALVLVGMKDYKTAIEFMAVIVSELGKNCIRLELNDRIRMCLDTPHAQVRFIYNREYQQLDGLRADVVFGHHDDCARLLPYLKNQDRHLPTMALRDWIVEHEKSCEARDRYVNQDVVVTAEMSKMWRTYTNSVFGLSSRRNSIPEIKRVHFSGPVTCVIWTDGTKTLVRCSENDVVDYEKGLAMAIAKKVLGTNKSGSNYYDTFKQWLPQPEETEEVPVNE